MGRTAKIPLDIDKLHISSTVMRALAHPLRLQIIRLLKEQQSASVQVIYTTLEIEQSVASQHLRILRDAKLVYTERQGKFIQYHLEEGLLFGAGVFAAKLSSLD